jgi:hypothetical protein
MSIKTPTAFNTPRWTGWNSAPQINPAAKTRTTARTEKANTPKSLPRESLQGFTGMEKSFKKTPLSLSEATPLGKFTIPAMAAANTIMAMVKEPLVKATYSAGACLAKIKQSITTQIIGQAIIQKSADFSLRVSLRVLSVMAVTCPI